MEVGPLFDEWLEGNLPLRKEHVLELVRQCRDGGLNHAQFGTRIGTRLKAEHLRVLLALLVMSVSGKIALELLLQPADLYSLAERVGG